MSVLFLFADKLPSAVAKEVVRMLFVFFKNAGQGLLGSSDTAFVVIMRNDYLFKRADEIAF